MFSSDVVAALTALAATATGTSFTIDELLRDLCAAAAQALDVDGASVTILEPDGLRFIHASPQRVADVEALQEVLQRGPCHDAIIDREMIIVQDIAAQNRWPEFAAAAAAAGLRATIAMPLIARDQAWGALDVYRNSEWTWTPEQLSLVQLFARTAASYLVMASDRDLAAAARITLEHAAGDHVLIEAGHRPTPSALRCRSPVPN